MGDNIKEISSYFQLNSPVIHAQIHIRWFVWTNIINMKTIPSQVILLTACGDSHVELFQVQCCLTDGTEWKRKVELKVL